MGFALAILMTTVTARPEPQPDRQRDAQTTGVEDSRHSVEPYDRPRDYQNQDAARSESLPAECCTQCASFTGCFLDFITDADYLYLLSEYGQQVRGIASRECVDSQLNGDGHVDLSDLLAWELYYEDEGRLTLCGDGSPTTASKSSGTGVTLPPGTSLNVNVPPLAPEDIRGVAITRQGALRVREWFDQRVDPRDHLYYWMAGVETVDESAEGSPFDDAALRRGCISVTPLHYDLTHESMLTKLETWDFGIDRS